MEQLPLLIENPPFIMAPNIELTQSNVKRIIEERKKGSVYDCDICGKDLGTPYYLSIGIPPSPLIIDTFQCKDPNYEKNTDFKTTISQIQSVAERFEIDSRYQWIFSEQNIISSITRVCADCRQKYNWGQWRGLEMPTVNIQRICFAVEEYQRLHTPFSAAKSNYERYVISLPDRTNAGWQHFGEVDLNANFGMNGFDDEMRECLTVALIPGYRPTILKALPQEFRANFIQDKVRVIPNDQELTRWMKKCINEYYDRFDCDKDWSRIQFCKIFINPKAGKFPIYQDVIDEECTPRYKIVVHYSVPKGDWDVYDIPDMGQFPEAYIQKKLESLYSRTIRDKKTKVLTR
jgi:hypothetical protein